MNFRHLEKSVERSGRNKNSLYLVLFLVFSASCSPASMEAVTGSSQGAGGTPGFIFGTLYFILMAFFAYFFLVIKPQQVEEEDRKKFVSELKKGTEVTTRGGLIGKIVQIKDDIITLEIAPKLNVQVKSSHIEKNEASK